MKSILKASLLSALFILTSCAHHHGCTSCGKEQCEMHKDCSKDQCPMKSEHKDSAVKEEAPAKK